MMMMKINSENMTKEEHSLVKFLMWDLKQDCEKCGSYDDLANDVINFYRTQPMSFIKAVEQLKGINNRLINTGSAVSNGFERLSELIEDIKEDELKEV